MDYYLPFLKGACYCIVEYTFTNILPVDGGISVTKKRDFEVLNNAEIFLSSYTVKSKNTVPLSPTFHVQLLVENPL